MATTKSPRRLPPVSSVELNIRRAWQHMAEEQGLLPAAAYWRWRVLHSDPPHPVFWLTHPWGKDEV